MVGFKVIAVILCLSVLLKQILDQEANKWEPPKYLDNLLSDPLHTLRKVAKIDGEGIGFRNSVEIFQDI